MDIFAKTLGFVVLGACFVVACLPIYFLLTAPEIAAPEIVVQTDDESISCYSHYGTPVTPEFEINNVLLSINYFDSVAELQADLGEGYEDTDSLGECYHDVDKNIALCELWVTRPSTVEGDAAMMGLGHEAAHGAWGDYHKGQD